jgi:hypothetical protein
VWLRTGFSVGQFLRRKRKLKVSLGHLSNSRVKKRVCVALNKLQKRVHIPDVFHNATNLIISDGKEMAV